MKIRLSKSKFTGSFCLPGDKSIAHRALIFASLSCGNSTILNFPLNEDCLETRECLRRLGVTSGLKRTTGYSSVLKIKGKGLSGLTALRKPLFIKESGTTFRLLAGLLAGQRFPSTLTAGKSLSLRPMRRVTDPLCRMGADITARRIRGEEYPPLQVQPAELKGITYRMPVASAQVKSALLIAGLYAQGTTTVLEKVPTRDHTERMLRVFSAPAMAVRGGFRVKGGGTLKTPGKIVIPSDISSAAFLIVLACIVPGSRVSLKCVNLNPGRMGALNALLRMGADISTKARRFLGGEPAGDILARYSSLRGIRVRAGDIPAMIDELPILLVAACLARGRTVFEGVAELRVKETDRISSMTRNLKAMGADIISGKGKHGREDIIVNGRGYLQGARVQSYGDHRTAMSMVVAGLCAQGSTQIAGIGCIKKSFPGFLDILGAGGYVKEDILLIDS